MAVLDKNGLQRFYNGLKSKFNNVVGYGTGKKISEFAELTDISDNSVLLAEESGVGGKVSIKKLFNKFLQTEFVGPTTTFYLSKGTADISITNNDELDMTFYIKFSDSPTLSNKNDYDLSVFINSGETYVNHGIFLGPDPAEAPRDYMNVWGALGAIYVSHYNDKYS